MSSYKDVAQALALRYSAANITPPAGQSAIRSSTEKLPEALGGILPCIVVFPPATTDVKYGASLRMMTQRWPVRFYLAEAAPGTRDWDRLYDWADALKDTLVLATHIALPSYVAMVWIERVDIGELTYAGQTYVGLEHSVMVKISEGLSPVA